mmetsp:Transcript_26720/g.52457  ORF Transcript_26720/g.52457 Transcript_26720/m.52457 type:complete len:276 (+) Transcript_26720:528-1355(+)
MCNSNKKSLCLNRHLACLNRLAALFLSFSPSFLLRSKGVGSSLAVILSSILFFEGQISWLGSFFRSDSLHWSFPPLSVPNFVVCLPPSRILQLFVLALPCGEMKTKGKGKRFTMQTVESRACCVSLTCCEPSSFLDGLVASVWFLPTCLSSCPATTFDKSSQKNAGTKQALLLSVDLPPDLCVRKLSRAGTLGETEAVREGESAFFVQASCLPACVRAFSCPRIIGPLYLLQCKNDRETKRKNKHRFGGLGSKREGRKGGQRGWSFCHLAPFLAS